MSQIDPQQTSSSAISKFSTLTGSEDKHCLLSVLTSFYPRDAVLARVLAMALCLYVCLSVSMSVTSLCSVETVEQIGLVFGMGASVL